MSEFAVGDKAPSFRAKDQNGRVVSLKDFEGKKLILYFYPKDLTPGCTVESCDFRDSFADFAKAGFRVVGMSPDNETSHQKFIEKEELNFDLLVDEDKKIAEKYGVFREKNLYGRISLGIVRSTFVIDEKGKFLRIYDNVKAKGHVDKLRKDLLS